MVTLPDILVLAFLTLLLVSTGAAGDGEYRPINSETNCCVLTFFGLMILNFLAVGLAATRRDSDSDNDYDYESASNSSDSSSDSESLTDSDRSINVTEVFPPDWMFIKTGKSGPDGVLVTHRSFVFYKDSNNRKGDINSASGIRTFHVCSQKRIGCTATAVTLARMVQNEAGKLN